MLVEASSFVKKLIKWFLGAVKFTAQYGWRSMEKSKSKDAVTFGVLCSNFSNFGLCLCSPCDPLRSHFVAVFFAKGKLYKIRFLWGLHSPSRAVAKKKLLQEMFVRPSNFKIFPIRLESWSSVTTRTPSVHDVMHFVGGSMPISRTFEHHVQTMVTLSQSFHTFFRVPPFNDDESSEKYWDLCAVDDFPSYCAGWFKRACVVLHQLRPYFLSGIHQLTLSQWNVSRVRFQVPSGCILSLWPMWKVTFEKWIRSYHWTVIRIPFQSSLTVWGRGWALRRTSAQSRSVG